MENISAPSAVVAERDAEIRTLLEAGWAHADVAARFQVERQRIQQIAERLGIGPARVNLHEIQGGYAVVGDQGTDEEAIRTRIERALRTAKLDVHLNA